MILKGSVTNSIGHAGRLAHHLLNERDNERVEVLEISGHATDDARQAMLLMQGAVTLTKANQGVFQVSVSPEPGESMTTEQWADARSRLEGMFSLQNQPAIIIEHTKEGRTHRHYCWQTGCCRPLRRGEEQGPRRVARISDEEAFNLRSDRGFAQAGSRSSRGNRAERPD